ncbi:DUF4124 domain-containing protein [Ramlibacter tataouinensis]|uniref:DUF4124 domain-containing protein n=1 Tax=Ramlibacter tataouinensis TaxID=94132 RepID=UPI000314E03C|nr:DUF4124 domain-containing protein [Ramlibacter tataouinensis]
MVRTLVGMLWAAGCTPLLAQAIYTCVDAQGRRVTSDRPILACIDREQKELNPSGTVRRRIAPSPTAAERAAQEAQAREAAEERSRLAEEKRRGRALLTRFPQPDGHEKERRAALALVDDLIATAHRRAGELADQRKALDTETEFYRADPAKMPPRLKRLLEENDRQQAAQLRYVAEQQEEKQRINARFDEELVRLKPLWALQAAAPAVTTPAGAAAAR